MNSPKRKRQIAGTGKFGTALVLSGGGARGAYEAGVLLYLFDALPSKKLHPAFDIFTGSSIGALNTTFLASMADNQADAVQVLAEYWRSLTMNRVLKFGYRNLFSLVDMVIGRQWLKGIPLTNEKRPPNASHPPIAGIFETSPIMEDLRSRIPWDRLQANIDRGIVRAIALCATEVCTGQSVIFHQTAPGSSYRVKPDHTRQPINTVIGIEHAMASAAIPFIFPSIQIEGTCYADGSIRQNTPIGPAMRLGADKLLVISLSQKTELVQNKARLGCRRNRYPGYLFLLGRMVSALMNEALDYELRRIDMFNNLIQSGEKTYGPDFLRQINKATGKFRNEDYRMIGTCHIHPSQDLNLLALDALRKAPDELDIPGPPGAILKRVLFGGTLLESELLSTMLFTPTYIKTLFDLGYEDARSRADELREFFSG